MNRPVLLLGNGVRNNPALINDLCQQGIPVLTTWQFADGVPEDSPVFCGRPGVIGQRASNIILQKCDWLMIIGARLDMETVGHNLENFAPRAHKIVIDIDAAELKKFPSDWERVKFDLDSANLLITEIGDPEWLTECKELYSCFRPELDSLPGDQGFYYVDPYAFIAALSDATDEGDVFVPGSSGVQSCAFFQAFKFKRGQRSLVCNTIGSMGMEPMAIGASIASGRRVIVVTGDGGFAQNFQELEVVGRLNLPIHYFVFDNGGYGSIAVMQDGRFGLRVGSDLESGFTLPHLARIAETWHMPFYRMSNNSRLGLINEIISQPTATLTSVRTSLDFRYACKVQSSTIDGALVPDDLSDMTPKLDSELYARLMR